MSNTAAKPRPPAKTRIKQGAVLAAKRFVWVALPTLLWVGVSYFDLINEMSRGNVTMIWAVVLFTLSIPCGVFLRMDHMFENLNTGEQAELALLGVLPVVLLNFLLLGAYFGLVAKDKPKRRWIFWRSKEKE